MGMYDAIGGADAVGAAVDDYYRRVIHDPVLSSMFAGVDVPGLRAHMCSFLMAAVGGPEVYTGRDMATVHRNMPIKDIHFDRMLGHLAAALADRGAPPETVDRVGRRLAPLRGDVVNTPTPAA